ncbi:MAG: lipoyl synthase [Candidatus Omnitrophica bacterium]|nr:lipoyl synthase [Candidatus Omnitrophota bacterium]
MSESCGCSKQSLPEWFRQEVPDPKALGEMRGLLRERNLHTVCEGAHCPNMGQCWKKGTATMMILGDTCTRRCRFCAVDSGEPSAVDQDEPLQVADAVRHLGLKYVVVTSVTRDDLPDEGAGQFARTVRAIKDVNPRVGVEVLIPDLSAEEGLIRRVIESGPDVVGHNLETVRRLSPHMRSRADHDRSLLTLRTARRLSAKVLVKSGFMVGLGESDDEVLSTLRELKGAGCDIVTIGQYLAPSKDARHAPVERFVTPEAFSRYREEGLRIGIKFVHSGPLVRSSYLAEEGFNCCQSAGEALVG